MVATLTVALPTWSQTHGADRPDDGQVELAAPRVDWSHAIKTHRLIEGWIDQGGVELTGGDSQDPLAKPTLVTNLVGVRVGLRYAGRQLGVGEVPLGDLQVNDHGVADLIPAVRLATQRALADARNNIEHRNQQAQRVASDQGEHNIRPVLDADWMLRHVQADLQIAHQQSRIHIDAEAPVNDVFGRFASGYHGLILTAPSVDGQPSAQAISWPGAALAGNQSQNVQLMSLLAAVGMGQGQLPLVGRPDGAALDRFHCIHIVRPNRTEPVLRLTRGHLVLPPMFNEATLAAMGDRMTAHLQHRLKVIGPLRGVYLPSSNSYQTAQASSSEAALTAYALSRRSKLITLIQQGGPEFAQTLGAARQAVQHAETMLLGDGQTAPSPRAMGLLTLALMESPQFQDRKQLRDQLVGKILRLQNEDGAFRQAPLDAAPQVDQTTQAILTAALTSVYQRRREELVGQAVLHANRVGWRQFQIQPNVSALNWLLTADSILELKRSNNAPPQDADTALDPSQKTAAVQAFVKWLLSHQITQPPDADLCPADVLGGFNLASRLVGESTAVAKADWRSAEILTLLALCLRDDGLIEADPRDPLLLRCSLTARFVAQLMVDQPSTFYMSDPDEAIGGVRQASDNNELDLTATAHALIAVTQLQRAIHDIHLNPQTQP